MVDMDSATNSIHFKERLIPGPGLFIALFLLAPAGAIVMLAVNTTVAIPVGLLFYAVVMAVLCLSSPVVKVQNGTLTAGSAQIPVSQLGEVTPLGREALKLVLGTEADARNFLIIRGWIQTGVSVEIADPEDPTPRWVITTRRPQALAEAIESQRVRTAH